MSRSSGVQYTAYVHVLRSMHLLNVTDGLMVQVTMETMTELRRSLREMKDFTVTCGKLHPAERQECVHIQWQDEEPCFNKGLETNIYTYI